MLIRIAHVHATDTSEVEALTTWPLLCPIPFAGGEKRRLSIVCAVVAGPSIIFLDEPTSEVSFKGGVLVSIRVE